jgi:hypothetical protein
MKTLIITTTIVLAGIILNACDSVKDVVPGNNVITQEYTFSGYENIETESAFTVYVEFSDTEESIVVEANENLFEYIEVSKGSDNLKIGFRENISIKGSATLQAYVKTKNISGYVATGASRFIVEDEIFTEDVTVFLSGASQFMGEIYAENLYAEMSGASSMKISGESASTDVTASGASGIGDFEFSTEYLRVNFSGASIASLTVTDKMDVSASGASIIRYKGGAVINSQNLSGGSQIIEVN